MLSELDNLIPIAMHPFAMVVDDLKLFAMQQLIFTSVAKLKETMVNNRSPSFEELKTAIRT